jgi:hypothetical protein
MRHSTFRMAVMATLHCLLGCSIGEVFGMVLSTAWNLGAALSVGLSVVLAFGFGYGLSLWPLVRGGMQFGRALRLALVADTVSIASMELMDNAVILAIPAAINAGLTTALFWESLGLSLVVAFGVTVPVNWGLIRRGRGHAVMHNHY